MGEIVVGTGETKVTNSAVNSDVLKKVQIEKLESLYLPLVNRFYKNCRYSAKAGRGEEVYVAKMAGQIIAAVRLSPKGGNRFFLRSFCVSPEYRRQGVGRILLRGIEPKLQAIFCYCYPFRYLQGFYQQAGFRPVEQVPDTILQPYQRYCRQGRDIIIMVRGELSDEVHRAGGASAGLHGH